MDWMLRLLRSAGVDEAGVEDAGVKGAGVECTEVSGASVALAGVGFSPEISADRLTIISTISDVTSISSSSILVPFVEQSTVTVYRRGNGDISTPIGIVMLTLVINISLFC